MRYRVAEPQLIEWSEVDTYEEAQRERDEAREAGIRAVILDNWTDDLVSENEVPLWS